MLSAIVVFAAMLVFGVGCRADVIPVGGGSYTDDLANFDPQDHGPKFTPRVTDDAPHPYPTSDWWTSVLSETWSQNLFAIPLAFRCDEHGLLVDRPGLLVTKDAIYSPFEADLRIGLQGTRHEAALAAGWGDFTVDIRFPADKASWTATIGHGLPFAYATFSGSTPEVSFLTDAQVIHQTPDSLLVRFNKELAYGLYFVGEKVELDQAAGNVRFPGCTYLAVAALPDETWFDRFRPAAFQRVTESRVDYSYDVESGEVTTTYQVETVAMKGDSAPTYLALFPHHYKHQDLELTEAEYDSIRGRLKVVHADRFSTVLPFNGIMPYFPEPTSETFDPAHLRKLLDGIAARKNIFTETKNEAAADLAEQADFSIQQETYFHGKQLAHVARLIPIADLAGHKTAKDRLIAALRTDLANWFTATPGETEQYFYYDRTCGGLIGMNSSFYTYNYTDHHFHYAHFVYAAAILSLYDSEFREAYGGMVEFLIHDYNSPDREHAKFPRMRMMDPYESHSWANGLGGWGEGREDDGNDQESSSEAMHAWQAIFLWGVVTGNERLRDHGAWGYVTEASAINQYYFDVDDEIYPNGAAFKHSFISMLQGGKASFTGYSDFPEYIFGIQYIPVTPGSLYLGYNEEHARRQYADFVREKGGVEDRWYDILWMYRALFDPESALDDYDESLEIDDDGSSFANVYHWLHFFAGAGRVDVSVAAPWPCTSAFRHGDQITVMAFNAGSKSVEVPFRERATGAPLTTLTVAPGSIATGVVPLPRTERSEPPKKKTSD